MTYRVLAYLLSLLLDLATLARRDAHEQELEILLLRPKRQIWESKEAHRER